jgi:hypothetical protein
MHLWKMKKGPMENYMFQKPSGQTGKEELHFIYHAIERRSKGTITG